MCFIPIHMLPIEVKIDANRRQVFQFITSFDASPSDAGASSNIISREENRLLVEFKTPISIPFRKRKIFRTVERVILQEPERVDFEEVEGPFAMRRERIILLEKEGKTHLQYEANLGMKGWIFGWLLGLLFVRPRLKRAVQEHFKEIKETVEKTN